MGTQWHLYCTNGFVVKKYAEVKSYDLHIFFFSNRYGTVIAVHIIPVCHGLLSIARMGSVYVTMSITLERYFAIVHPLKDFVILKKFLLPVAVIFSISYNFPKV